MAVPGLLELLILAAILFALVGVPIIVVLVVLLIVKSSKSSTHDYRQSDLAHSEPADEA